MTPEEKSAWPGARCLDRSFAVLVAATLATWAVGEAHAAGAAVMGVLLALAFVKSRLVVDEFMGLRSVKFRWRALMLGWLVVVLGLVALAYWKGMP